MNKYYTVTMFTKAEQPGPHNGFGDYPNRAYYRIGPVEAETKRKAQAAFKRQIPNLRYSQRFGPWCVVEGEWDDVPVATVDEIRAAVNRGEIY